MCVCVCMCVPHERSHVYLCWIILVLALSEDSLCCHSTGSGDGQSGKITMYCIHCIVVKCSVSVLYNSGTLSASNHCYSTKSDGSQKTVML